MPSEMFMFCLSVCLSFSASVYKLASISTDGPLSLRLQIRLLFTHVPNISLPKTHHLTISHPTGWSTGSFLFVRLWVWVSAETLALVVPRLWNNYVLPNPFLFIRRYIIRYLTLTASLNEQQKWLQTQELARSFPFVFYFSYLSPFFSSYVISSASLSPSSFTSPPPRPLYSALQSSDLQNCAFRLSKSLNMLLLSSQEHFYFITRHIYIVTHMSVTRLTGLS
jgi:hypothetical protein